MYKKFSRDRVRTYDLSVNSRTLYQLSYTRLCVFAIKYLIYSGKLCRIIYYIEKQFKDKYIFSMSGILI